jgi:hypothetical protein
MKLLALTMITFLNANATTMAARHLLVIIIMKIYVPEVIKCLAHFGRHVEFKQGFYLHINQHLRAVKRTVTFSKPSNSVI